MKKLLSLALIPLAGTLSATAAITDNLVAYYDFEDSGTPGLANKAPGATTHHGAFLGTPSNGADSGFAGDAVFAGTNFDAGAETTTNRSTLLAGKALNVVKGTATAANGGQFTVSTLTSRGPGVGGDFGTLGTQFSVSAWFYLAPDADNSTVVADSRRDFVFESLLDGATTTPVFDISWGSTAADTTIYSPYVGGTQIAAGNSDLAANAWHHVVHTFTTSGANTQIAVYVNGNFVATGSALTTNVDFRGINFGANRNGTARVFDGLIDEIGLWNRPLTAAEVTQLHQLGQSGQPLTAGKFILALSASEAATGTVTGSGAYDLNDQVSVAAVAKPGYVFASWEGDFAGQPVSFNHTVTANVTATATFDEDDADPDGDDLTNFEEIVLYHTLPNDSDTDDDLIPDGAEVRTTFTSPTASDAQLVNFVRDNLDPNEAGAIALSPLRIDRNPGTGAISLFLSLSGSADQDVWQAIDLSSPSASIVPAGDGWNVTFPAPSNLVNSYVVRTNQP